jgi:hypothetical protein
VAVGETPETVPLDPVEVSNIEEGDDRITFDVDQIGQPVLVRASYFPNWQVSGAAGPYRVTPNLMVVIPTDTHVSLHYGWTPIDLFAWILTFLGLVGLFLLWRSGPIDVPPEPERVEASTAGPELDGEPDAEDEPSERSPPDDDESSEPDPTPDGVPVGAGD